MEKKLPNYALEGTNKEPIIILEKKTKKNNIEMDK